MTGRKANCRTRYRVCLWGAWWSCVRYAMTPGSTAENGKPTNANTKTSTTQHSTSHHIIRSQCTSPCKLAQVNTQHTTFRTQNRTDHTHRHTSPLNTMHD